MTHDRGESVNGRITVVPRLFRSHKLKQIWFEETGVLISNRAMNTRGTTSPGGSLCETPYTEVTWV